MNLRKKNDKNFQKCPYRDRDSNQPLISKKQINWKENISGMTGDKTHGHANGEVWYRNTKKFPLPYLFGHYPKNMDT